MKKTIAFTPDQHAIAILCALIYGDAELNAALCTVEKNINRIVNGFTGATVLHLAVTRGYNHLVRILLDAGADIDSHGRKFYSGTPLISAVKTYNLDLSDTIELLLARGANVEAVLSTDRYTSLMIAVFFGNAKLVEILLAHGANVEAKNARGETALMIAVNKGNGAMVKLLLNAGADMHAKNHQSATPFMRAALNGKKELLKLFIDGDHACNSATI